MKKFQVCPHCKRKMIVYRRNIRKNMIYCLRRLYEKFGRFAAKVVAIDERANIIADFPKLEYWGLIRESVTEKNRWHITDKGVMFLEGRISVPKYKWVYNGELQQDPPDAKVEMIRVWDINPDEMSKAKALAASRGETDFYHPDLFGTRMGVAS